MDFLEIDLGKLLDLPGCERDLLDKRPDLFADDADWRAAVLKLFLLIFGRGGFLPDHRGETFHVLALREGMQWEAQVARDLSDTVFHRVFRTLAQAIATADGKDLDASYLEELRDGALILLYRLLFVLYAEDRNLLPDETGPYADYSLTRLRLEIAERRAKGAPFSDRMTTLWSRLQGVFQAIGQGDNRLGIPPYNGGLFDPAAAPILSRVVLPDGVVAEIIFRISHTDLGGGRLPKYINYRDLSVQQLGSVYERILEHGLKVEDGRVAVAENPAARKGSGSYYTPEELVKLIIERAVGPLVTECIDRFAAQAALVGGERRANEARIAGLMPLDPASRLLDLKICDPAMGSGHFLVSLVDWLSDRVLEAMAEATAAVNFALYVSPLAARLEAIRAKILAEAKAHGWPISEAQLDDRHIVRRMVLKRVVDSIDKNPMAAELAKVALWLHSFTVGAPLSFLDHHLRCGDSVLGAWARPTLDALRARGALFNAGVITRVEQVTGLMAEIEETTDNDIAEVAQSKAKFGAVKDVTQPVAAFFSLLTAEKLMGIFERAPKKAPLAAEKMAGKSAAQVKRWRGEVAAFGHQQVAAGGLCRSLARTIRDRGAGMRDPTGRSARKKAFPQRSPLQLTRCRGRALAKRVGRSNRPRSWRCSAIRPISTRKLLGDEVKRALKPAYASFDGVADLSVKPMRTGKLFAPRLGRARYRGVRIEVRGIRAMRVPTARDSEGWRPTGCNAG